MGLAGRVRRRIQGNSAPVTPPPSVDAVAESPATEPPSPPPAAPSLADYLGAVDAVEKPFTLEELQSTLHGEDLMDLGTEAQAQGRALAVRTVMNRLASVAGDLERLDLPGSASMVRGIVEGLDDHVAELMGALEQRGRLRRGEA